MCTENALKTKCKAIVHSRIPYPIHEKPNGVFLFSFWFFVLSFLFLHVSISESLFISTESAVIVCVSHFETIHNGFENQVDMQATKFFFFPFISLRSYSLARLQLLLFLFATSFIRPHCILVWFYLCIHFKFSSSVFLNVVLSMQRANNIWASQSFSESQLSIALQCIYCWDPTHESHY